MNLAIDLTIHLVNSFSQILVLKKVSNVDKVQEWQFHGFPNCIFNSGLVIVSVIQNLDGFCNLKSFNSISSATIFNSSGSKTNEFWIKLVQLEILMKLLNWKWFNDKSKSYNKNLSGEGKAMYCCHHRVAMIVT